MIVNEKNCLKLFHQADPIITTGKKGQKQGEFDNIGGIACYKDLLYVCDNGNARIQVFNFSNLHYHSAFKTKNKSPWGITIANDKIYVSEGDFPFFEIGVYSLKGTNEFSWQVSAKGGLASFNNVLYHCEENGIKSYSCKDAKLIDKFGKYGTESQEFDLPYDICVNNNYMYVSDYGNHRIQVFSVQEKKPQKFLAQIGTAKSKDHGKFNGPRGLTVGENDNLLVVDSGNHRIQEFTYGDQNLLLLA